MGTPLNFQLSNEQQLSQQPVELVVADLRK